MTELKTPIQKENILIKGAKGGGKGGGGSGGSARAAQESPDSLRSRAFARIIDLISEGEIEGLVTGDLKSVYLDRTRVQNTDGSYNFTGITAAFRNGTQNQSHIPGFESVESEESVGVQITADNPVVHTVSDTSVDACRVTIGIPQLTNQNPNNGDISGTSVQIAIDVQPDGGSYTQVISDTIQGKTTTRYQRSYRVALAGTGPWNVRVRRITKDSNSIYLQNTTWWDTFTEIKNAKLAYPNSAIVAAVIDAKQFSNIPTRGYDTKLLRTQIPSNASVNEDGSLSYSGSWDGTFQVAWHANPAWVFYDMVTTERYGLGQYIDATLIDKWTLYTIGRYCDEQVSNGFGGFEPRFTCNIYFQTQAPAFKVLQDLASVFRGMIYWSSGLIVPTQDSPAEPVALYTKANVIGGKFTRSGTSLDTRHSVALVTWNDPADFYTQKVEYVEDAAAIDRYGIKQTQVVAVGCTSRGQAHRVGKWLLYSEANDTDLISFRCGIDSLYVRPGQIMAIQDADRAGARLSGRLVSATTTSVTIDRAFTPASGANYSLMVMMPDGTVGTANISNIDGTTLTLASALSDTPVAGAVWMVKSNIIDVEKFRVIGITDLGGGEFEISGLEYNALKYAAVEENLILTPVPTSLLNTPPDAPTGIQVSENLYERTGGVAVMVSVAWVPPDRAVSYIFSYQRENGNIVTYDNVVTPLFEIEDAIEGQYVFNIIAVGPTGKRGSPATKTYNVIGKTTKPGDVQNFTLVSIGDGVAHLSLTKSVDLDVLIGGFLRVRWSPSTSGAEWTESVDIGPSLPGVTTNFPVPHVSGTFLAKFVDSSGNQSENAAVIVTSTAILLNSEQITSITESPDFDGTRTNTTYDEDLEGLVLSGSALIDDIEDDVDDWDLIDYLGGIAAAGYYDFPDTVDFGAVYPVSIRSLLSAVGFDALDLIDSRTDLVDSWSDVDGDGVDDTNAGLLVSTSTDMSTWRDYVPFFIAQVRARGLKFRLALTSETATHNIAVTACGVTIDIPDRTEQQNGITSGTSTYSVTFPTAFYDTPGIAVAPKNMQSGDYFVVSNESATGFDVDFYNSADTPVSRVFDYIAKGQGMRGA